MDPFENVCIGSRVMIVGDQTVPIRTIAMFVFMLNTFTSLTAKKLILADLGASY